MNVTKNRTILNLDMQHWQGRDNLTLSSQHFGKRNCKHNYYGYRDNI